jgi:sec-independent protein translocase protein TatA
MPFGISIWELLILLVVLLLIFGAKRLPEMGRSLGKGMREFKDSVTGVEDAVSSPTEPSTPPTPSPSPGELPSARSEPASHEPEVDAEEAERETVR